MTDREALDIILSHLDMDFQAIIANDKTYVEIENGHWGEDILFEFDEAGKIILIGS